MTRVPLLNSLFASLQRGGTTKAATPAPDVGKGAKPGSTVKYEWKQSFSVPATMYKVNSSAHLKPDSRSFS